MEVKDDARRNYVEVRKKALAEEADAVRRKRDRGDRGDRGGQSIPSTSHMKKLEEIRLSLVKSNDSFLFRRPVDKKAYPAYYEMIERPMDLDAIKKNLQKRKYGTAQAFLEDLKLMHSNSCQFNSAENPISLSALNLVNLAKKKVAECVDEFAAWEAQMVPVVSSPSKKRQSPVKAPSPEKVASPIKQQKALVDPNFPLPPSKLMVEPCMYKATFNGLGFKRSAGFTVTETQEQRAARFARMKKRKRSITDVDELHQVEGKSNFHISSIANEAKLAASFINVNITTPVIQEQTRAKIFKSVIDMKGLLAPTDGDSGFSKVAWSGREEVGGKKPGKMPKAAQGSNGAGGTKTGSTGDGNKVGSVTLASSSSPKRAARDAFGLTFAFRGKDDQLGLYFQSGIYTDTYGRDFQALFVSDVKQDGQAKELADQKGKDFVSQRTRVTNFSHTAALKEAIIEVKSQGGGLLTIYFLTAEPMVARVFGEGSIGGVGSPSSVPLKKRKPEQHAAMQEKSLAALHTGPLKKRKLVAVEDGDSLGRIAAAEAAEMLQTRKAEAAAAAEVDAVLSPSRGGGASKKRGKAKKLKTERAAEEENGAGLFAPGESLAVCSPASTPTRRRKRASLKFLGGNDPAAYSNVWRALGFVHKTEEEEEGGGGLIPLASALLGWRGGKIGQRWTDKRMCVFCECYGDDDSGVQGQNNFVGQDLGGGGMELVPAAPNSGGVLGGHNPFSALGTAAATANLKLPQAGRLIPVDFAMPGTWAHTACALWSSEVYEDEFGKLYAVQKSKVRTRQIRCAYCGLLGAGLGCCSKDCKDAYHFKVRGGRAASSEMTRSQR